MQVCEVLADRTRVQIVEMLAKKDLTAGEIAERFDVTRPAISQHLRVLRETGIATVTRDAQRWVYRLDPAPLMDLEQWLLRQRGFWNQRLDALGEHLDRVARSKRARKLRGRHDRK